MPVRSLDWIVVIALLGAVQGVFLAGALASKRRNRTANRLLAAAMLAFSIHLATVVYHGLGLERAWPHFFGAAFPLPLLYGPLIYLYAVTAADRSHRLAPRDALHFLPAIVAIAVGVPVYAMSGAEKVAFHEQLLRGNAPTWIVVIDQLKLVSGIAYATATIAFLRRHRERVKESYSTVERVNLRWLLWLGGAAAGVWAMAVAFEVMQSTGLARIERSDHIVAVAIAALVYAIGYRGLRQPEIFRYETAEFPVMTLPSPVTPAATPIADGAAADAGATPTAESRYERSGLTARQAQRLGQDLRALMDEAKPWQDPELTLADLAARLQTTPHKLSEVLNTEIGQSFYDFVNRHRVEEVQRRIAAGEARRVKLLTIAMNAGFASKSTFNLVFKKHTNQTPSAYQQAMGT